MSALDDAIAAHLAHAAASGTDPLTDSLCEQAMQHQPAANLAWLNEPTNPPHPFRLYALCVALCLAASLLLSGCGGGNADDEEGPPQQIPTPPACQANPVRCQ